jgi:hypothetical protein
MTINVQVFCFLASYLVSLGLEFSRLLRWRTWNRFVMLGFGAAGFVAHTLYLLNRSHNTQLPPLLSSAHDWFLVLAWVLALVWIVLAIAQSDLPIGAFGLPVVLVLVAATYFMTAPAQLTDESQRVQAYREAHRAWTMLHAGSLVLGMVSVAGGLVAAVMYLAKHHQLRSHQPEHQGWRMPSLERLAAVNRGAVICAFLALTVGIVTGVVLVLQQPGSTSGSIRLTDPLILFGTGLWIASTILVLWLLTHRKQSGRQVAWLTACACGFLLLTLVGLPALLGGSGFHSESSAQGASTP